MIDNENYQHFPPGPDRQRIKSAITALLADAEPDTTLTNRCRDYWLAKDYTVVLSHKVISMLAELPAVPQLEGSTRLGENI